MTRAAQTSAINSRRKESRLTASARRALKALRPILAKLPCRSTATVEGRHAFLPTTDEMAEARGSLFALDQALDQQ